MDLSWQPALPEDHGTPASTLEPTTSSTLDAAAPQPSEPITAPPPASVKATGLRRLLATAGLTIGLLAVGGVSVAMAASPAPSASSAPSTTQPNGAAPGGTAPAHRGSCPNMTTNGPASDSGFGSGSGSPGSSSPSASG